MSQCSLPVAVKPLIETFEFRFRWCRFTWEMPPASADTLLIQAVGKETRTRLNYDQRTLYDVWRRD